MTVSVNDILKKNENVDRIFG